jgi:LemA protein
VEPAPAVAVAVLVVLVGGLTLWLYGAYTGLLVLRRLVDATWEQVDDELRRRHDLVPNVLARFADRGVAPGAAGEQVTAALFGVRTSGSGVAARVGAERLLSQALEALFAVADPHPALRGDESYLALRRELGDIQARATAARRLYNTAVARLEARREQVPVGLVARLGGVRHAEPAGAIGSDPRTGGIDLGVPPAAAPQGPSD